MKLLVKNELQKIFRQPSFKALLIIFLCLLILIPSGIFFVYKLDAIMQSQDENDLEKRLEAAIENGDRGDYAYCKASLDTSLFFEELGKSEDSCEAHLYRNSLFIYKAADMLLGYIEDGTFSDYQDLRNNVWQSYLVETAYSVLESEKMKNSDVTSQEEPYRTDMPDYENFETKATNEFLASLKKEIEAEIAATEEKIRTFDLKAYYKTLLDGIEAMVKGVNENAEYLRELIKNGGDGTDNLREFTLRQTESALKAYEYTKFGYRFLYENVCEYNGWEYVTVMEILDKAPMTYSQYTLMTEEEYASAPVRHPVTNEEMNYSEYSSLYSDLQGDVLWAMEAAKSSLERGVPLSETVPQSSKRHWRENITTMVGVSAIIMVVFAGTTMSNEYSSGSVRLLLIRPKKRSKILASKIYALGITWSILLAASYVILFFMNLILFGVSDIFMPDITYAFGTSFAVPSFVTTLVYMLEDTLAASTGVMLALLLSLLIKRAALSIAVPIIFTTFTKTMQVFCQLLYFYVGRIFAWLPFAYFDLSPYRESPVSIFISGTDLISLLMGETLYETARYFNLAVGIAWMAVITAGLTLLSFVSMKKQQIKN